MGKKRLLMWVAVCLVLILGVLLLLSCTPAATTPATTSPATTTPTATPHPIVEMQNLAGPSGYHLIAATAEADVITKNHPWIRVSAIKTGDIDSNYAEAARRDPNTVLYQQNSNSYQANTQPGVAATPFTKSRWIAGWDNFYSLFATRDPKIKSLADLKGKTISVLPGPFIGTNLVIQESIKALGILDQVTIKPMAQDAGVNAMRDGLVDVAFVTAFGGLKSNMISWQPFVQEAISTLKGQFYLVAWNHAALDGVQRSLGWSRIKGMLPAGSVPGQTAPVEAMMAIAPAMGCQADADENLIYEITKTLVKNYAKMGDYSPQFKDITPETMVKLLPVYSEKEVHPGAIKYYKEVGLWNYFKDRYVIGPKILD